MSTLLSFKYVLPVEHFIPSWKLDRKFKQTPLYLFHVSFWIRAHKKTFGKGRPPPKKVLLSHSNWTSQSFLLTVEPVSNRLKLPIGAEGEIGHTSQTRHKP